MCIHELFLATFLSYTPTTTSTLSHFANFFKSGDSKQQQPASPSPRPGKQSFHYICSSIDVSNLLVTTGNPVDELFANNKSIYSNFLVIQQPQVEQSMEIPPTSIVGSHHLPAINTIQDVEKLFKYYFTFPLFQTLTYLLHSAENNKQVYKLFEPLLTSVLQTYLSSHDVETKQVALSMLSQLSKFGVWFY